MLYQITNELLTAQISDHGAEITSILYLGQERMHDSNPKYWNRTAPLLFPNVGAIKDGQTIIQDKSYPLTKHGFLRDKHFEIINHTRDAITLFAEANDQDRSLYPFHWKIKITYQVVSDTISSDIVINNLDNAPMPFNFGLHPAFRIPLAADEKPEDYLIEFAQAGTYRIPTVQLADGTIDFHQISRHFENLKALPFRYSDYAKDALVFDDIRCQSVTLRHQTKHQGVVFAFPGFPMLGIWTPSHIKAPFVCIEPWIGCADTSDASGYFADKKDLIWLNPNEVKQIHYHFTFF